MITFANLDYVNSPALSGCHPYFRQLTPIKNTVRYHPHLFQVTHPKTAVLETSKFIYLASLLTDQLCSYDNLEITVRYQK